METRPIGRISASGSGPLWVRSSDTSDDELHRNVRRVVDAGAALGVDIQPRRFPDGTKTAADAAAAIGVDVGQIVKSLIFSVDGAVVAYVSGRNQLDESKLAAAAGGEHCGRVDADTVRTATGFPIGGVPPFGHAQTLPVFVDPDLLQYDEVWAAAGTWNDVFGLAPDELVRASGGVVTDLRRA
ncbi:hypothetical protein BH24ACT6_BH24ACT6_07050 [soil metagenome]